jgi:hypothetical protein
MLDQTTFTPEEWRTLQFAPFWMLSAVVGGYRRFDPLELEAFARCLKLAALAPGRLNQEIATSVTREFQVLHQEYRMDGRTIAAGLCEVAGLLRRVPPEEAEMFRGALVAEIGEGIARARGRFGRVMSEEDAKNVELVSQFLS